MQTWSTTVMQDNQTIVLPQLQKTNQSIHYPETSLNLERFYNLAHDLDSDRIRGFSVEVIFRTVDMLLTISEYFGMYIMKTSFSMQPALDWMLYRAVIAKRTSLCFSRDIDLQSSQFNNFWPTKIEKIATSKHVFESINIFPSVYKETKLKSGSFRYKSGCLPAVCFIPLRRLMNLQQSLWAKLMIPFTEDDRIERLQHH